MEQLEDEVWKPIQGFEEIYEISNHGRLKALPKSRKMPGNGAMKHTPEIIRKLELNQRYPRITLCKNGIEYKETIHKLVAMHFVDNPEGYTHVRHLDDNPWNPHYKNLAWGTQKMNMEDKVRNGRQRKGETMPTALLTEKEVLEIREKYDKESGYTYKKLGEMYNVNKGTVGDLINRRTWKHI